MFALIALLGLAGAGEPAAWSDLAPWRTWVVLDDVSIERQWFAIPETPGVLERCELGVAVAAPNRGPVVHCGDALHSDVGARPVPRSLKRMSRRARAALESMVGATTPELDGAEMVWLGRLRRVSFRQVVVTRADPDPGRAAAYTLASFWDVDLDTGRVDRGVIGSRLGEEPLCFAGLHAGCDAAPRLIGFEPADGWDGHLIDVEAPGAQAVQTAALQELVRQVAMPPEGASWRPAGLRDVGTSVLPASMDAGMSLQMELDVQRANGDRQAREVTLDLPLNQAAFDGVALEFGVDGTAASVQVDAKLEQGHVVLHLGRDDARETLSLPVACSLLRDEARAVATSPCTIQHPFRTVTWVGEGGVERVTLRTARQLVPLIGPSRGPEVR